MGSVFPTSGTGGAKMRILPVEWGLWGDTHREPEWGFVCPPLQQDGGPPDVVEFGEKGE